MVEVISIEVNSFAFSVLNCIGPSALIARFLTRFPHTFHIIGSSGIVLGYSMVRYSVAYSISSAVEKAETSNCPR